MMTIHEFDWMTIVKSLGRSRTDFSLTVWEDHLRNMRVIRLTCNCCGHWAQERVCHEALVYADSPISVVNYTVERLTRFMLGIGSNVVNAIE